MSVCVQHARPGLWKIRILTPVHSVYQYFHTHVYIYIYVKLRKYNTTALTVPKTVVLPERKKRTTSLKHTEGCRTACNRCKLLHKPKLDPVPPNEENWIGPYRHDSMIKHGLSSNNFESSYLHHLAENLVTNICRQVECPSASLTKSSICPETQRTFSSKVLQQRSW